MVVIADNGGIPYDPIPLVAGQTLVEFQGGGFPHRWLNSVQPTAGQTFQSIGGTAVIDGCYQARFAFASAANNVTIRDLEVRNFVGKYQGAAVQAFDFNAGDNLPLNQQGQDWLLEDLWVHSNGGIGVGTSTRTVVRRNRISHNGQMGMHAKGGADSIIEDSEVHHNNVDRHLSVEEAGGTKFKYTSGYRVRRNYFHDNWGYGIWFDINNTNATIARNLVEDHERAGIFWEINFGPAFILNNTVRRAGIAYNGWAFGAGIISSTSGGPVNVRFNHVEQSANGITMINQDRPVPGAGSAPFLFGISVTDNVVIDSGHSGFTNDFFQGTNIFVPQPAIFEWDRNTYQDICVGTARCGFEFPPIDEPLGQNVGNGNPFRSGDFNTVGFAGWQALGFDQNGAASGCTP